MSYGGGLERERIQLERMQKKLELKPWLDLLQGNRYVPVGKPEDGEVCLETEKK